ncbi:MAG: prepilin peptidase [Pseudomonadota bacterium]
MLFEVLIIAVFPAALLVAAVTDLHDFTIPNWVSILLLGAYVATGVFIGAPIDRIVIGLGFGAIILVIGFALFAVKFFGGGDAKLFAACAPWIGFESYLEYLTYVALAGGVFGLLLLAFRKAPPLPAYAHAPWLMRIHQNQHEIPYGVAICIGGLLAMPSMPYFKMVFPS